MQGEEGKIWSPEATEASKTSNRYVFTVLPLLAKSDIVQAVKEATGTPNHLGFTGLISN